jgi:hypothetical protein
MGVYFDDNSYGEVRQTMLTTKPQPATVGEILSEEFLQPLGLTQGMLAKAMGVQRKLSTSCATTVGM